MRLCNAIISSLIYLREYHTFFSKKGKMGLITYSYLNNDDVIRIDRGPVLYRIFGAEVVNDYNLYKLREYEQNNDVVTEEIDFKKKNGVFVIEFNEMEAQEKDQLGKYEEEERKFNQEKEEELRHLESDAVV